MKKTKSKKPSVFVSSSAAVGAFLLYSNKDIINEKINDLYSSISESINAPKSKLKGKIKQEDFTNIAAIVKTIGSIVIELGVDPDKIKFEDLAKTIVSLFNTIEARAQLMHSKLIKFGFYNIFNQQEISKQVDDFINYLDNSKKDVLKTKKPKSTDKISLIKFNLYQELAKQFARSKKEIKVKRTIKKKALKKGK